MLFWEKQFKESPKEGRPFKQSGEILVALYFTLKKDKDFSARRNAINKVNVSPNTMFKNITLYIFFSVLIAAACSFVTYSLFYNPFNFSQPLLVWTFRLIIYLLLAWWFLRLDEKESVPNIAWLSLIIPTLAILMNTPNTADGLLNDLNYQKIMCYSCLSIVTIWLLYILFSKSKTLLGFLVILNIIVSLFIFLPYGVPRIEMSFDNGFNWNAFNFSCFPYYTLHNYRPFIHEDKGWLSFILDIRTITTLLFIGYEVIVSAVQTTRIKYTDNLEEGIKKTQNSIQQFFLAGLYFVWNIIRRFLFFTKSFWKVFKNNLWEQIKKSVESYVYAVLIIFAFISPFAISILSSAIMEYDRTTSVTFISFNQIAITLIFLFFFLFPLLLAKLLKAQMNPFKIYQFNPSERPSLFLPIYITLMGIGISSVVSCFMEKSFGLYLILFLSVLLIAGVWGYINRKPSQAKS
ncbi:MAG TPA: hypothetical protein PKN96_12185 [Flavobacterium sp.]|uniref:hypothetical protein n=1 Tax=Flavobacterium sp. TaxID=239 RepID=UPI002B588818|nr:hypothetical protein [Flavobacterium sp.]HNP34042.1 hypothetical protein [Flavobacterium sp.]